MGMTLKELLTKGEGTLSAQEAKALAAQCRMDVDTLRPRPEERGIKIWRRRASRVWTWTASLLRWRTPKQQR